MKYVSYRIGGKTLAELHTNTQRFLADNAGARITSFSAYYDGYRHCALVVIEINDSPKGDIKKPIPASATASLRTPKTPIQQHDGEYERFPTRKKTLLEKINTAKSELTKASRKFGLPRNNNVYATSTENQNLQESHEPDFPSRSTEDRSFSDTRNLRRPMQRRRQRPFPYQYRRDKNDQFKNDGPDEENDNVNTQPAYRRR